MKKIIMGLTLLASMTAIAGENLELRVNSQIVCAKDKHTYRDAVLRVNGILRSYERDELIATTAFKNPFDEGYQLRSTDSISPARIETVSSPSFFKDRFGQFNVCVTITEKVLAN